MGRCEEQNHGKLPRHTPVTDRLVLGSRIFVQDIFAAHRDEFGPKRQNCPRPIRQAALPTLFALRDGRSSAEGGEV
jgi:hypothetical protein